MPWPKLSSRWPRRRELDGLKAGVAELAELVGSETDGGHGRLETRDSGSLGDQVKELARDIEARLGNLTAERAHLRAVLDSLSEGVLVADARGRAVLVNPPWQRLFGVSGEAGGTTAIELTQQAALDRAVAETLESGKETEIELEVSLGQTRTVIVTSAPLTDGAGVVVLARDLTPFLRAGEIRRDFVANVSHELKTPLSAIRGFAETLADGALEDPQAAERFTRRILRQCERLEALLSDLLTLSRLEHPAASSGWAPVDMRSIVEEAVELTSDAAADRGLEISVDLETVRHFDGDAEALARLSTNLLENAVKYNRPEGRVEVRLFERAEVMILEVTDTGIGIPPGALERLFERFYRVDKGRSREEGGTGLGLAIVKHAAQLHGGKVEVESELGRGSTFRALLPSGRPSVATL